MDKVIDMFIVVMMLFITFVLLPLIAYEVYLKFSGGAC